MTFRRSDGANQLGDDPNGTLGVPYSDNSGYTPFNTPDQTLDIERWRPERVPIDPNPGEEERIQEFLTPQWGNVIPFGLDSGDQLRPEAPQPLFEVGVEGEIDFAAKTITLMDGIVLPVSTDLIGSVINPEFVAQAERVIEASANLTDEQKLIAEFWEDAGGTSFPPGTFMTFGQFVSARDDNSLDNDAALFFALGNAVFDAGIATWEAKIFYDYVRPVRAIRDLGELGLVGEFDPILGGFAIEAWAGPGEGTQTILATDFLTYQTPGSDPSPPFAEYTSGHSAFSASGAEILKLFTGSDAFGGSVTFQSGESRFEPGITPENPVTLEWETFGEAADEAGISRIYGGIHFDDGDLNSRALGRQVGTTAFEQALFFINGGQAVNSIVGTEEPDILPGTENNDRIVALGGNDIALANDGDDTVLGGDGDNFIDGGNGFDTAVFSGPKADFDIVKDGAMTTVSGAMGTTTLTNTEVLQFDDTIDPDTLTEVDVEDDGTVNNGLIFNTTPVGVGEEATANLTDDVTALGTDALFDNLISFYQITDENGGIDTDGDGVVDLNPGNAGYARAAITNRVDNFEIRAGSSGNPDQNTTVDEFGNVILAGGQLFAPFVIANGGGLGFDGFVTAEDAETDGVFNDAADFAEDQVTYFSFIGANPDGVAHLKSLGNNVFGFEDLPSNIFSDMDFNDAIFNFSFTG